MCGPTPGNLREQRDRHVVSRRPANADRAPAPLCCTASRRVVSASRIVATNSRGWSPATGKARTVGVKELPPTAESRRVLTTKLRLMVSTGESSRRWYSPAPNAAPATNTSLIEASYVFPASFIELSDRRRCSRWRCRDRDAQSGDGGGLFIVARQLIEGLPNRTGDSLQLVHSSQPDRRYRSTTRRADAG